MIPRVYIYTYEENLLVEKDGVDEMEQVIQLFLLSGGLVLEKKYTQPH